MHADGTTPSDIKGFRLATSAIPIRVDPSRKERTVAVCVQPSEGVRCSQSINSSGGYLDFGVAGGNLDTYTTPTVGGPGQSAIGYARLIIPIGAAPKRLDCSRLYDLEIQRLKAEIQMLKVGLQ